MKYALVVCAVVGGILAMATSNFAQNREDAQVLKNEGKRETALVPRFRCQLIRSRQQRTPARSLAQGRSLERILSARRRQDP